MINIKNEFEQMIHELKEQTESEIFKLHVLTAESPIILAGIDSEDLTKQLYIDLGDTPWESELLNSLPRWRGLSIKVEHYHKLFMLKNRYFLIFSQKEETGSDIFDDILQNLVDHLTSENEGSMYSKVYKVLDRWRSFFLRGGFSRLSDEEQRGLFGELWFINEWLDTFPDQPPLIIEQWDGPTKGRIDFRKSGHGLEIKTVSDKLSKTIKISNENQLKLSEAVKTIHLYVCFLEQSKTHGMSLQYLAEEVRNRIAARSDRLALLYSDLLVGIGFKEEEYTDTYYFVEKTEVYEADASFPRIVKEGLPKGISHVSYNIDLTHCAEFEREKEDLYQYFRLEG